MGDTLEDLGRPSEQLAQFYRERVIGRNKAEIDSSNDQVDSSDDARDGSNDLVGKRASPSTFPVGLGEWMNDGIGRDLEKPGELFGSSESASMSDWTRDAIDFADGLWSPSFWPEPQPVDQEAHRSSSQSSFDLAPVHSTIYSTRSDGAAGSPRSRRSSVCSFLSETRSIGSNRSEFFVDMDRDECLPDLTDQIAYVRDRPDGWGGYADVYKGAWSSYKGEYQVAVKAIRTVLADDEAGQKKKDRRLRQEIDLWTRLDHPNVVPLFGVTYDFPPLAAMVCPWHGRGNLSEYAKLANLVSGGLDSDRCLQMMIEISNGLEYLHHQNVIHGDLTGSNILLTEENVCCLSDFGLSKLLVELQGGNESSIRGALRWSAPELHRLDWDIANPRRSTHNDIFSLASVFLQLFTGRLPYAGDSDTQALIKLVGKILPTPTPQIHVPAVYLDLMRRCWAFVPSERPSSAQVASYLFHVDQSFHRKSEPLPYSDLWADGAAAASPPYARRRGSSLSSEHKYPGSYHPSPSPSPSSSPSPARLPDNAYGSNGSLFPRQAEHTDTFRLPNSSTEGSATATSALMPPKLAPSAWQLYFTDWIQSRQRTSASKLNVAQAAKEAGQAYANLSQAEKEPYKRRSHAAKEVRERELAEYMRTLSPDDIKRENAFRAAQPKVGNSLNGNIKDPNAPKKPLSAYFMYLHKIRSDPRLAQEVFGDEKEKTKQSVLTAAKWRSMTNEQRQPFISQAEKEKLDYEVARRLYEEGTTSVGAISINPGILPRTADQSTVRRSRHRSSSFSSER